MLLTPDGTLVAFLAPGPLGTALYAAPADGSTAPAFLADNPADAILTADGSRAVYRVLLAGGASTLYAVLLDGSSPPVPLLPAMPSFAGVLEHQAALFGDRILYLMDAETNNRYELYSVPADGSASPVKLNAPLAVGSVNEPTPTPDGSRVLYLANLGGGVNELYSVSVLGGPSVKLNATPVAGGRVRQFFGKACTFAPGLGLALYVADQDTDEVFELYARPFDGSGAPVKLSGTMVAGGDVTSGSTSEGDPRVSADSSLVLFLSDRETDGTSRWYTAPCDGSAAPVRVSGSLSGFFYGARFTPDSARVVMQASDRLWSAPADGSAAPVLLSSATGQPGQGAGRFLVGALGERVVYLSPTESALYSAPVDGSAAPVLLSGTLAASGPLELSPDGGTVYFRAGEELALSAAPVDAGSPPTQLSAPLQPLGQVNSYAVGADGARLVYLADAENENVFELYSVPSSGGGAVRLSEPMPETLNVGDVLDMHLMPDGRHVVYVADQEQDGRFELFAQRTELGAPSRKLSLDLPRGAAVRSNVVSLLGLSVSSTLPGSLLRVSPDSRHVAYWVLQPDASNELFQADLDGGSVPLSIGTQGTGVSLYPMPQFSPDSNRIVAFLYSGGTKIVSAPTDGSSAPVVLDTGFPVEPVLVSADSAWVIFRQRPSPSDPYELWSVPIDGSMAPVLLSAPLLTGDSEVVAHWLTPDSAAAVYCTRQRLYRAPLDGSPPVQLGSTLTGGSIYITLPGSSSDGSLILSLVQTSGQLELFSQSTVSPTPAVKLNGPLVTGGSVKIDSVVVSGARVLYLADQELDERFELYSVPITGGTAVKLNGPLVANGDVVVSGEAGHGVWVDPSGERVLYFADQELDQRFELFSVPIAGGPAVKLNAPLVANGDVAVAAGCLGFAAGKALYLAQQEDTFYGLYAVPVAGGPSARLSPSLAPSDTVNRLEVSSDGSRVVFLNTRDQNPSGASTDQQVVTNVYLGVFAGKVRGSPPPGRSVFR